MLRKPIVTAIAPNNAFQQEQAVALQVLYVLGLADVATLKEIAYQTALTVGPPDAAYMIHHSMKLLLQSGVHVTSITPRDTLQVAGQHSAEYLRSIWERGGYDEEMMKHLMAGQPAMQSRATYLRGYIEMWHEQWQERIRNATHADIIAAYEAGAVIHTSIIGGEDGKMRNILVVPSHEDQCWVYNALNGNVVDDFPIEYIARQTMGEMTAFALHALNPPMS